MSPHFPHVIVVNKGRKDAVLSWYVYNEDKVPAIHCCGPVP